MERLIVWHRWCPPAEPSPEAVAQAAIWRINARSRFVRDGGEVLLELGGTVAVALDPADTIQAVELCLSLLLETQSDGPEFGGVSQALTVGGIERSSSQGTYVGDALDRAQALANKARPGDVVLDTGAQSAAAATFLFARTVSAGPGVSGEVIDPSHPRRRDCRAGLSHLAAPALPASAQAQLAQLRSLAQGSGRHRVLLVGAYGVGTSSWLRHLASELKPPLWLDIRALSTSLSPLSGLSYALRRLPPSETPEAVLDPAREADKTALTTLINIRSGAAVGRRDAGAALRQLLARVKERSGARAWLTVTPAPLVDPATIGVVAEVARDGGPDCFVVLRMPLDSRPPDSFARGGSLAEIRVPGLSQSEARALAQSMLGKHANQEIARRAAAMGGSTPLGVAEAVRVLICTGDVIHEGGRFRWRRGPAGRVSTLTIEGLLDERIDEVGFDARRLLEALATVPDPDEGPLVEAVTRADGLGDPARSLALEELVQQALVDRNDRGLSLSRYVRAVVEQAMPPARLAELSRFVASAVERNVAAPNAYAAATLAYYVARGSQAERAASILLDVALHTGQLGFVRSGVRLAAAAVECEPTDDIRAKAAAIAGKLSEQQVMRRPPSERPKAPDAAEERSLADQAMAQAIDAILVRDFDGVDRALELVVAAGRDGPSVDRLRALALLAQGDKSAAQRLLDRARRREHEEGKQRGSTKTALATALMLLETGDPGAAVREGLRALAQARERGENAGEQAALKTLSLCYERLGRNQEAESLRSVRTRVSSPPLA